MLRVGTRRLLTEPRNPFTKPRLRPRRHVQRTYADLGRPSPDTKDSIRSSDAALLPGSHSPAAPVKTTVPTITSATPKTPTSTSTIPPENVPLTPPPPHSPPSRVQTAPPTTTPLTKPSTAASSIPPTPPPRTPPSTPPDPAPRRKRRGLRFLLYLVLASGIAYGGSVFYALRNDNYHDFFTEYIPFGEEVVLYFEERSFRKRFPNARQSTSHQAPTTSNSNKVTIPSGSGLSWRVTNESEKGGSDLTQKGRHVSAVEANAPNKEVQKKEQEDSAQGIRNEMGKGERSAKEEPDSQTVSSARQEPANKSDPISKLKSKIIADSTTTAKSEETSTPSPATPSPKSDPRPPAIAPITQLSPLEIANADEPLVQDLVKIVNDIITVINSDSPDAANKYFGPMDKAKDSLASVGDRIMALKEAERKAAEDKINQLHKEFEDGAQELLRRIDAARQEDDAKYREEFESEREKLSHSYEEKLKTELERSRQLAEQNLQNQLTEQAIEMKRKYISEVKSLVEQERDSRLSKLSDLSTNVNNLQELTSNWNGVIDSNLATQKLQVAVDAVRAALSRSTAGDDRPKPFVREMAALKLVANGDPIIDAAIASINPTAYQRGIPSPAQLIDRFRRVAAEVRKASLLPENAGVASHAASLILSKVMFKKQGQPQGRDVESVLTRTETMLEEGDVDGAAREMNTLSGWAAVLSKDWLQDCRKVLEVQQALEVIETEARLQCLRVE